MIIKIIILEVLLSLNVITDPEILQNKSDTGTYEIVKVQSYMGKNLEAVYKINYKNKTTNSLRFFEVIKTDRHIKDYFLADFLLIERVKSSQKIICYPTGWESLKAIKESELKETCQLIVKGKIVSASIE
jgi:hypothetical protein